MSVATRDKPIIVVVDPSVPDRRGPRRAARDGWLVLALMGLAAVVLAIVATRAEVLFADGLRYIEQARRLERGAWRSGLRDAIDHPLYPASIAAVHRLAGLGDGPPGWQAAAQGASVLAGVALVVPLWLLARELFGRRAAGLGVFLAVVGPLPVHVMADTLSESTFLLAWTWGAWGALRFLRSGRTGWLVAAVGLGALSYLARPEGLLLPAALVATLGLMLPWPAARFDRARWTRAVGLVLLGGIVLVGPFVAYKGGIGTKPAVARLLGLAPPSPRDAVERERPLDLDRTLLSTYLLAVRAAAGAVQGGVGWPLLPFAALGMWAAVRRRAEGRARVVLFLGVVAVGALAALVRLHATGGYCTPRHALILSLPLLLAAGAGVRDVLALMPRGVLRRVGGGGLRRATGVVVLALGLSGLPALAEPINAGQAAYGQAGGWLAAHVREGERVVDVTGWSLFYGSRPGYTFANLHEAPRDPAARWVAVRDAHLAGPWAYCRTLRALVKDARPVARFPAAPIRGVTRVTIFDRGTVAGARWAGEPGL